MLGTVALRRALPGTMTIVPSADQSVSAGEPSRAIRRDAQRNPYPYPSARRAFLAASLSSQGVFPVP